MKRSLVSLVLVMFFLFLVVCGRAFRGCRFAERDVFSIVFVFFDRS